ncbi:MAG: S8 family serine peptidase [Gaiellaceae bacterium]
MKPVVALAALALALVVAGGARAFNPNDPFVPRQWYVAQDRAFEAFDILPALPTVRVAVIDSGVDSSHPELLRRIVAARSFVGGSPVDVDGHGTFVAGEIAAAVDNGIGIAGLAPAARLLVAKVVRDDGSVSPDAEARAIRWAVNQGARVINVSLGGLRDPADLRTGFSSVEQQAIDYATANGALVVAAVGNGDGAPVKPWRYASYPAALPHVLGVGSYGRDGNVPVFSNRDDLYVDLVAPGEDIFSLFPRTLTAKNSACADQGYSNCGPKEYRHASGTSFSAPQATAAAAMLFSLRPNLTPDQVSTLLERTAIDATPATGCPTCSPGRDAASGFGYLDEAAAVRALRTGPLPVPDRAEPNDDISTAATIRGHKVRLRATIDYWDDPNDVYRIKLRRGQWVSVLVQTRPDLDVSLALWKPALRSLADAQDSLRARRSVHPAGVPEFLRYRARESGWYYLQVKLARPGSGPYWMRILHS